LECLYLLLEGKLQVGTIQVDGKQAVFSFETPFSIIGDLEVFEEYDVIGNVQVLEPSLVLAAPVEAIRCCGYDDTGFLRFLNRYLVKKVIFSSTLLAQVTLSVETRLAQYLLYRMEREEQVIQLENRESLAALMGVSVRHLNRTFRKLIELQAVEVQHKALTITNTQVLSDLAESGT
jgi:CRP-like cAMP-binding protein